MPTCRHCQERYNDKSVYNKHISGCKPEVEIDCPNGTFMVARNEEGNFVCQCSDEGCPRPFQTDIGLIHHLRQKGYDWNLVIV